MTYKQIEASRERRFWLTQVIVPAVAITVGTFAMYPNLRRSVSDKFNDVKDKISSKINRKKGS